MRRLLITGALALSVATTSFSPAPAATQEAGQSAGWWNTEWPYRRAVTLDTSGTGINVSGPVGRTLVLVRLHSGNFSFADSLDNGADLRVVDSDGKTPLPFHIERYDAPNGLASLWVSVPNVTGGEKRQVWLYFGNKTAPAGSDVAGSFDPDTVAAYHFGEAAGQPLKDLTANKNNGQGGAPGVDENGIVARAGKFAGGAGISVPGSASLTFAAGSPVSVSGWVKPDRLDGEQSVYAQGSVLLGMANGLPFLAVGEQRLQASAPLKVGSWAHLAFVGDGQSLKLYVNGAEVATGAGALPDVAGPATIGGAEGRGYFGELDEIRIAKTARPAAMVLAMAQAEGPGGKLVRVSDVPERQSEGGGNFFYVLGKVESVDAVIIGLCLLLLALSMGVTVFKARYLGAASRGDRAFSRRYAAMHEQLVSLKEVEGLSTTEYQAISRSPLARIFETGIDELGVRRKERGLVPLSGAAVDAMRSAVDAVVVRENQKLDRWMVVLSIAISGGPFIGLFGTVIGVMNTFAGVARAGDVNVNAIAPGIAAALMATVAGLLAAIPSLFANNWLAGRIQLLSDDMRVFADRLITRLAEMQETAATPANPTGGRPATKIAA